MVVALRLGAKRKEPLATMPGMLFSARMQVRTARTESRVCVSLLVITVSDTWRSMPVPAVTLA